VFELEAWEGAALAVFEVEKARPVLKQEEVSLRSPGRMTIDVLTFENKEEGCG
jgi:hypothetical protein